MRSRFTVGRKKRPTGPVSQTVALGIDLGMRWTKLAMYTQEAGCRACSLGGKELAIDPAGGSQPLRGVTETVGVGPRGARNFKPLLGSETHTPDTNEKVEEVVQRFIQSLVVSWLSAEGAVQVSQAAATYPVSFPMLGRLLLARCMQQALSDAGCGENPQVTHMLPEPVAVILAQEEYRNLPPDHERTIVVYDLGGSTFDAALVGLNGGNDGTRFTVLATTGLKECGSHYFDEKIKAAFGLPPGGTLEHERIRLSSELRKLMRDVSDRELQEIEAEKSFQILNQSIRAADIRGLLTEEIERTANAMTSMLTAEELHWEDVDVVLLNGGGSLLWFVPAVLKQAVPNIRVKWAKDPILGVAMGAAHVAGSGHPVEVSIPFAEDVLLETPGASTEPRDCVLFRRGEYPPAEGASVKVHSQVAPEAAFVLRERLKESPMVAFCADLEKHTEIDEELSLRFTVDGRPCIELYGGTPVKGAMLVGLEVTTASGKSVPVKPVLELKALVAAKSSGWTLEQHGLRVEIGLLLDATESARSANLHRAIVEAIEGACGAFLDTHQSAGPSVEVRVVFYGDDRLQEPPRPQKPCPLSMLRKVVGDAPHYVGGDAEETSAKALERLAEAWRELGDSGTVRVACLCCDADDAELSTVSWEQNAPRLQQLTELVETMGGHLCVIGQPRGWLERWLSGLRPKPELIPLGSPLWLKSRLSHVLETAYGDLKRRWGR